MEEHRLPLRIEHETTLPIAWTDPLTLQHDVPVFEQAADILAYEVYKDFTAQMEAEDGGPKRGMRRSFRELLVIRDGGGYLFTGERAALLMKGIAAWEGRRLT